MREREKVGICPHYEFMVVIIEKPLEMPDLNLSCRFCLFTFFSVLKNKITQPSAKLFDELKIIIYKVTESVPNLTHGHFAPAYVGESKKLRATLEVSL